MYMNQIQINNQIQLEDNFQASYTKLNPEQKLAVDTIDGPLLVIAGPGSGKTQILSLRVANILRVSDVSASNILCLTFTDSATKNMQDRLSKIIGAEAYQVHISTFHSFCSGIIKQYPHKFLQEFGLDAQASDDLAQYEIMQNIFGSLPRTNPLTTKSPEGSWFYLREAQSNIANLKKAGLDPDMLEIYLQIASAELDLIEPIFERYQDTLNFKLQGANNVARGRLELEDMLQDMKLIKNQLGWSSKIATKHLSQLNKSQLTSLNNLNYPTTGQYLVEELSLAWSNFEREEIKLSDYKKVIKDTLEVDYEGKKIFKDRKKIKKGLALVEIYRQYNQRMKAQKLYDFDDMILSVSDKLQNDTELAYNLVEKYQYILVDEFQDTSGVQLNLVKTLCWNDSGIEPNIMVVGDDDQAIYKFQGASTFNILNFQNSFGAKFISLKINYRSSAKIVNSSRTLASFIQDGIVNLLPEINKDIRAFKQDVVTSVNQLSFDSVLEENLWVSNKIRELLDGGVEAKKIAIISAKHKSLTSIVETLEKNKIPLNYERGNNVLTDPKIAQLIILMQYLSSINDRGKFNRDELLSQILAFDCFGITSLDIYRLASAMKYGNWTEQLTQLILDYADKTNQKQNSLNALTKSITELTNCHPKLDSGFNSTDFNQSEPESNHNFETKLEFPKEGLMYNNYNISQNILELFLFLLELGKKIAQDPGEKIIDFLLGVQILQASENQDEQESNSKLSPLPSGYVSHYKDTYFDKFWTQDCSESVKLLSSLQTFVDKIRSFSQGKILYLPQIVAKLDLYQQEPSLSIVDKSSFAVGQNSVSVLTSHKSKGLEFEYVFVVHCNQELWAGKNIVSKLSLPKSLPIQNESDNINDKLRNFYVAITRAENHLYLTNYISSGDKLQNKLIFLDSLPTEQIDWQERIQDSKLQQQAIWQVAQKSIPNIILDYDQKQLLEGRLQDYKLSVTHLNNFLDLANGGPRKFLENNFLQFPSTRSPEASYGTAVHAALHETYCEAKNINKKPDVQTLIQNFETALNREKILQKDKQGLIDQGHIQLKEFWSRKTMEDNYETERSFSYGVRVGEANLKGNIDKIIFDYQGRKALVMDYKTGKAGTNKQYKRATSGQLNGEFSEFRFLKNYNQLVFYKLLVENSKDFKNRFWVTQGGLEFVNCSETTELPTVILDITNEDEARLTQLIQAIWTKIMSLDFSIPTEFTQDYQGTINWIRKLVQ